MVRCGNCVWYFRISCVSYVVSGMRLWRIHLLTCLMLGSLSCSWFNFRGIVSSVRQFWLLGSSIWRELISDQDVEVIDFHEREL